MIEFEYPNDMRNGLLERFLVAGERLVDYDGVTPHTAATIAKIVRKHGRKAAMRLLGSYLLSAIEHGGTRTPPSEEAYRKRAQAHCHEATEELRKFRRDQQYHEGRFVSQCEWCGRVRKGLSWKHRCIPEGFLVLTTDCPECETSRDKGDELIEDAIPEETTHADAVQWALGVKGGAS